MYTVQYSEHKLMIREVQKEKRPSKWRCLQRKNVKYKNVASGYTSRPGTQTLPPHRPPTEYYIYSWRMRRTTYIYIYIYIRDFHENYSHSTQLPADVFYRISHQSEINVEIEYVFQCSKISRKSPPLKGLLCNLSKPQFLFPNRISNIEITEQILFTSIGKTFLQPGRVSKHLKTIIQ